jgi:DNA-binding CsgD family transcriptional regulator
MSKSSLVRIRDIRSAYRLIGECRDLASTPDLWQQRLFDGVLGLVGADKASGGEGSWIRPGPVKILSAAWSGFDQAQLSHLAAYLRSRDHVAHPILDALGHVRGTLVTRARRQLVPDRVWYRSILFNEYQRPADCDAQVTSICQTSAAGAINCVGVFRRVGARDFDGRERRLLHFFHGELGPLIGRVLVSAADPQPDDLPPRLRQTLHCLLQGDSEKQVAARLGLSQATIHEYVTAVYRRFRVHSRGELMAYVMRRLPQPAWKRLQEGPQPGP